MNLDELVLKAENLFVLPDSVTRLKACMDDEASSIDDIGDIIAFDPSLATQLLRVANSALYRFPNKIEHRHKSHPGSGDSLHLRLGTGLWRKPSIQ